MADDESTTPQSDSVDPTPPAEETATNEDTSVDTGNTDFEDDESNASWDEGDETTEADETEESDESATPEPEATEEESEDADTGESPEDAEPEAPEPEKPEPQEQPADDKERARLAYEQRQQERAQREQAKRDAQAEYLQAAEDDKDLALRQLQIDAYNNKVESNTNKLQNGLDKAVASIDLFANGTPAVKNRMLRALDAFEAQYVVKDRNGDPIEVKGDVYQYLQEEADSITELLGDGARAQDKAKSTQKARTMAAPSKAPKKPKADPDLEGFDEEAARW